MLRYERGSYPPEKWVLLSHAVLVVRVRLPRRE